MIQNILNEFQIKETIGKGTFSKVKLGINKSTGEKVAIKILEKRKIKTKNDQIRVQRELDILKKINHINIVKIFQTKEDQENIYIIMEFIDYDLFLHIVNNKRLEESESALYYFQLISGLEHIHSLNIVHRDLKPENLLLTKRRVLKIIDFGLSNFFNGDELLVTPCGSPSYTPPEMIKGYKYNGFAVDIWTTGIILYGMICGYLPFEERDNKSLFKKIVKCKVVYPKYISNNAQSLLKRILVANPDMRITLDEIKQHPFYLEGKNIFYKRYPDLVEKLENGNKIIMKQNYSFNQPNRNNNIVSQNDIKDLIDNNYSSEKKRNNFNDDSNNKESEDLYKKLKEKSSSPFSVQKRHIKNKANYELLKKVLRCSRTDSLGKESNSKINNETGDKKEKKEEDEDEEEEEGEEERGLKIKGEKIMEQKKNYSPFQLIRKLNKERQKFDKKQPQGIQEKYNLKTLEYEVDKNNKYMNKNNSNRENINIENIKINKTNTFSKVINENNYNKKYNKNKRNKNNIFIFGSSNELNNKKKFKCNTIHDDEEKNISLPNNNFDKNYKYNNNNNNNIKLNLQNYNYSINCTNETDTEYFDSFREYNKNNNRMRSYIINNIKIESAKNKSIINKKPKKTKSPTQSKYSGLSEKIISFNNLYNSIQNKLVKYNNDNNVKRNKIYENFNTIEHHPFEKGEKDEPSTKRYIKNNTKKNKNNKLFSNRSEEHRKKKVQKKIKNENNLKYTPSDLNKRLKSLKKLEYNSKFNIRESENYKSKRNMEKVSNSNLNNSMFQRHKNVDKNKNHNPKKNNKITIGSKNYNIQEIIKKRGLEKNCNTEKNNH